MSETRPPRMTDVANFAKVDVSVVSRVLSADPRLNIRQETRDRVLDAVNKLGYKPNVAARALRTARSGIVGLLIPDFANPVYAEIIKGAEDAAVARGLLLLTGSTRNGPDYLKTFGRNRADGILLAGGQAPHSVLTEVSNLKIPWLQVNRKSARAKRSIVLDDEGAAAIAVQHLVDLGHRRIAHLAGPSDADTARRRKGGYRRALADAGLDYDEQLVIAADYTPSGGAVAMHSLLAARPTPTAVFVANVASAVGAVHAAHSEGVPVPQQLSIIAVHDLVLAASLVPPLTAVSMPLTELGARAVTLLCETDIDEPIREVVTGPMELIERQSTAPPGAT